MRSGRIRVLALGIIWKGNQILVCKGHDEVKDQVFYRPLGGGIEFGEPGHVALAREMREELGAEITIPRYLGTVENLFTYNGAPGHEIIRLYETAFADPAFYEQEQIPLIEDDGTRYTAVWMPLGVFAAGGPPLYPDGLPAFLARAPR